MDFHFNNNKKKKPTCLPKVSRLGRKRSNKHFFKYGLILSIYDPGVMMQVIFCEDVISFRGVIPL